MQKSAPGPNVARARVYALLARASIADRRTREESGHVLTKDLNRAQASHISRVRPADGPATGPFARLDGEVSEWLKEPVSKAGEALTGFRGFESHPLRQFFERSVARVKKSADRG